MKPQPIFPGETYSFRRIHWKSFRVLYALILTPAFFITIIAVGAVPADMLRILVPLWIVFFFMMSRAYGLMTTVTIGPEGITCKTPLKTYQLAWDSIRTAGMYLQQKNSKRVLQPNSYSQKFYVREKMIFLSQQPQFAPGGLSWRGNDYVDFHYREKAWELICFYRSGKSSIGKQAKGSYFYQPGGNAPFEN